MTDPAVAAAGAWYENPRAVFTGGNDVRLLRGGDALFPAMLAAIAGASHEVWVATYIFSDDPAAEAVANALAAGARRGLRVRVVVDGFGSQGSLAAVRGWLESAGVGVAVFRPLESWRRWLQPESLRRMHHKLCVVDDEIAFVGGINLLDDRHDLTHGWTETPRLDYAVRLHGPVVQPVAQTVRALWTRAMFGRDWREEALQIARSDRPLVEARHLIDSMRLSVRPTATRVRSETELPPMHAALLVRDNLRQRRSIERNYIAALRSARRQIDIVSAYFYPGRAFRRALLEAARRGVQVRLLLQGKLDYRFVGLAAEVLYDELLAQGIRIFEYSPAFLHAKVARVDGRWATIGSSNIDPVSLLVNLEANVVVRDTGFVERLAAELERDFAAAREITAPPRLPRWTRWLRRGLVGWVARIYLRLAGRSGRY